MKKIIFTSLTLAVSFCFANLSAQSNAVYSIRNNETNSLLYMQTIVEGENNTVYVIGMDNISYDNFLMKIDNNGEIVWQKKLQTNFGAGMVAYNQIEFYNNEVYVLGTAYIYDTVYHFQYLLIKTDMTGNLVWSKSLFPLGQFYYNPSMSIKSNSGIIVSGSTYESIDIFSLNIDGTTNWIRNFSTDSIKAKNTNFDMTITDNGDIIGCYRVGFDMSFYCMGSNGNLKWARRVQEMGFNYTCSKFIIEINNNKFLVGGTRYDMPMYTQKGFYGFIDSTGSFLDFRMTNEVMEIKTGMVLNNGNILLDAADANYYNSYMIIDDQGNLVSAYTSPFGPSYYPSYNGITETVNYKYFAVDQTIKKVNDFNSLACLNLVPQLISLTGDDPGSSTNMDFVMNASGSITDNPDMQLVTSDLQLLVACAVIGLEENSVASIHIFPTALNNGESIYVNSSLENTQLDYQIKDMNGRMITQKPLTENSVPINSLSAGMYIIQFAKNGNLLHSEKFVVVN